MLAGEASHLKQAVTIEPFSSVSVSGANTYGTAVQYAAFVVQDTKMIRTASGDEVVSTSQVYLDGTDDLTTKDRITLPDATQPEILHIATFPGVDGTTNLTVVYT